MSSTLSNYLVNELLGWLSGSAFASAPSSVYAGLNDGDPTGTGTGGTDETATVSSGGRIAVTWSSVASRGMDNSAAVNFGTAVSGATVTHVTLWDAHTGGNMLASVALASSQTILSGSPVSFPISDLAWAL